MVLTKFSSFIIYFSLVGHIWGAEFPLEAISPEEIQAIQYLRSQTSPTDAENEVKDEIRNISQLSKIGHEVPLPYVSSQPLIREEIQGGIKLKIQGLSDDSTCVREREDQMVCKNGDLKLKIKLQPKYSSQKYIESLAESLKRLTDKEGVSSELEVPSKRSEVMKFSFPVRTVNFEQADPRTLEALQSIRPAQKLPHITAAETLQRMPEVKVMKRGEHEAPLPRISLPPIKGFCSKFPAELIENMKPVPVQVSLIGDRDGHVMNRPYVRIRPQKVKSYCKDSESEPEVLLGRSDVMMDRMRKLSDHFLIPVSVDDDSGKPSDGFLSISSKSIKLMKKRDIKSLGLGFEGPEKGKFSEKNLTVRIPVRVIDDDGKNSMEDGYIIFSRNRVKLLSKQGREKSLDSFLTSKSRLKEEGSLKKLKAAKMKRNDNVSKKPSYTFDRKLDTGDIKTSKGMISGSLPVRIISFPIERLERGLSKRELDKGMKGYVEFTNNRIRLVETPSVSSVEPIDFLPSDSLEVSSKEDVLRSIKAAEMGDENALYVVRVGDPTKGTHKA